MAITSTMFTDTPKIPNKPPIYKQRSVTTDRILTGETWTSRSQIKCWFRTMHPSVEDKV